MDINQKNLFIILMDHMMVSQFTLFADSAKQLMMSIFSHRAITSGKCHIVFISIEPIHIVRECLRNVINYKYNKLVKILLPTTLSSPNSYIYNFNHIYKTNYTFRDICIVECNEVRPNGKCLQHGRISGRGYKHCSLLLRPTNSIFNIDDSCIKNLNDMRTIITHRLDKILTYSLMPDSVYTSLKFVLDDESL